MGGGVFFFFFFLSMARVSRLGVMLTSSEPCGTDPIVSASWADERGSGCQSQRERERFLRIKIGILRFSVVFLSMKVAELVRSVFVASQKQL